MDIATKTAFQTRWEDCTPEQRALREKHLPRRNMKAAQSAYDAEIVRRCEAGEPLSIDGKRQARRLIRAAKSAAV